MAGLDLEGEIDLEQVGLPISNTENKLLEAEVQRKQKELAAHISKINQHKERIQAVGDHLKNVKQEFQHTQVKNAHILSLELAFLPLLKVHYMSRNQLTSYRGLSYCTLGLSSFHLSWLDLGTPTAGIHDHVSLNWVLTPTVVMVEPHMQ